MARKKTKRNDEPKELTRKQVRQSARERKRNRRIVIGTGAAIALALLFVIAGVVYEFVIKPSSTLAAVNEDKIVTRDYWKRVHLQQNQLQNQLARLVDLERQFGNQGFFTSQISQIEATLSSPFSLGVQVLDEMIEEAVIRGEAEARGVSVSDEEAEEALREQVAASQQAVTVPQATATAAAAEEATATAESWTPTPTPTIDVSGAITETEPLPTPEPLPTLPVLTEDAYQEGLAELESNIRGVSGMSLAEYREVIRTQLLTEKLQAIVANEQVSVTSEEVNARHILLRVIEPEPSPTPVPEGFPTPEPTLTPTPVPEGFPTPAPAPEPRSDEETLALAEELRQRILDGEDFAELAQEYSDDPGSGPEGGDLGWFGRGMMVPAFEEAAFSLEIGEISEPVRSDFGYHLIEVLEKDTERPKDEATLAQERQQAFNEWLRQQVAASEIERPSNIVTSLPRDLETGPIPLQGPQQ
jgi:parvulin-like peptidyl-prolyl isomerase